MRISSSAPTVHGMMSALLPRPRSFDIIPTNGATFIFTEGNREYVTYTPNFDADAFAPTSLLKALAVDLDVVSVKWYFPSRNDTSFDSLKYLRRSRWVRCVSALTD